MCVDPRTHRQTRALPGARAREAAAGTTGAHGKEHRQDRCNGACQLATSRQPQADSHRQTATGRTGRQPQADSHRQTRKPGGGCLALANEACDPRVPERLVRRRPLANVCTSEAHVNVKGRYHSALCAVPISRITLETEMQLEGQYVLALNPSLTTVTLPCFRVASWRITRATTRSLEPTALLLEATTRLLEATTPIVHCQYRRMRALCALAFGQSHCGDTRQFCHVPTALHRL